MRFVGRIVAHDRKNDLPWRQILHPLLLAEQFAVGRKDRFDPHQVELGDTGRAQRQFKRGEFLAMSANALGQESAFRNRPHLFLSPATHQSVSFLIQSILQTPCYTVFTGLYSPNTLRIASAISPSVHQLRIASIIGGIRFCSSFAALSTLASAFFAASALRPARTRATLCLCFSSSSGLTRRISPAGAPP